MHPEIVPGIVTGDAPVRYFFSFPSVSPKSFCEKSFTFLLFSKRAIGV